MLKQTSLSFVWFYQCLSVKVCCISPSDSEANRDGADAESPFPLFSLFLPHLRTPVQEKRSENCLRLGLVSRVSVCIHYCREI